MNEVLDKAQRAKKAVLTFFPTAAEKNDLLLHMADKLEQATEEIIAANQLDMAQGKANGTSTAMLDRLALNPERVLAMAEGLRQVSRLTDPVGQVLETIERPNGLVLQKVRVPLGVIAMIYEARPNVTVDAIGLCLKTGNAVILRGGSAALHSNVKLVEVLQTAMQEKGFPADLVQLIEDSNRDSIDTLLTCKEFVDVVIPRGGRALIQRVLENSVVPVIQTGEGICHAYLHEDALYDMAEAIVLNAKCQRPSVCNAIETLLVQQTFAQKYLAQLTQALAEQGVELRGCSQARHYVPTLKEATEEDWSTEYSDYVLAIKIVDDLAEAINHINTYGTKHSEAIITQSPEAAETFLQKVDAAAVYHNASTRFTDGFEFGFGAEIGISTQKLHARGPMGLAELTSYKYLIHGEGQIRG